MPTMDRDMADEGIELTARDVLTEEELAEYCGKHGGKPWDVAQKSNDDEDAPPWL